MRKRRRSGGHGGGWDWAQVIGDFVGAVIDALLPW
jgi:hypothetical protein